MLSWNSASGGFAYNWQSKWVGIILIETERTQIHFLSDVLVAVASLDLKVPTLFLPHSWRRSRPGPFSVSVFSNCVAFWFLKSLVKRHHEPLVLLHVSGFPGWLAWFSLLIFCLNNKIHFSLANANNSARFKRKMLENDGFCSFTSNKQTCELSCQRFLPG